MPEVVARPPLPAPPVTVLCSRCNHRHGGAAFGLCLEFDCDCIEPQREPAAEVVALTVQDWPPQFPTRDAWIAWVERDRRDEDFEMTWGQLG